MAIYHRIQALFASYAEFQVKMAKALYLVGSGELYPIIPCFSQDVARSAPSSPPQRTYVGSGTGSVSGHRLQLCRDVPSVGSVGSDERLHAVLAGLVRQVSTPSLRRLLRRCASNGNRLAACEHRIAMPHAAGLLVGSGETRLPGGVRGWPRFLTPAVTRHGRARS
jgi:hypothetical protein